MEDSPLKWLYDNPEMHRIAALRLELETAWDTPRRWGIIREYYAIRGPQIEDGYRVSPYELGLGERMTPIEYDVWCEIRRIGLPFYLQYPVGRRFVDFGDPAMRVAIEVDSKAYHTPEKDAVKSAEIAAEGWRLFRITSREAFYTENSLWRLLGLYGRNEDGSRYSRDDED